MNTMNGERLDHIISILKERVRDLQNEAATRVLVSLAAQDITAVVTSDVAPDVSEIAPKDIAHEAFQAGKNNAPVEHRLERSEGRGR
jgi:hypothetical protein